MCRIEDRNVLSCMRAHNIMKELDFSISDYHDHKEPPLSPSRITTYTSCTLCSHPPTSPSSRTCNTVLEVVIIQERERERGFCSIDRSIQQHTPPQFSVSLTTPKLIITIFLCSFVLSIARERSFNSHLCQPHHASSRLMSFVPCVLHEILCHNNRCC